MNIQFIRHIISEFVIVIVIFLSFVQIIHTHYAPMCSELESRVQKGISDLSIRPRAENGTDGSRCSSKDRRSTFQSPIPNFETPCS